MATTTPNYGWPVPTSTDYVKDGATAIEALGDAIDATVFGLPTGALTLISTTTIGSAVSSVNVTSAFSATYDNYQIIVSGGVGSGNVAIRLKLGATATGYYAGGAYWTFASASTAPYNQSNTAFWDIGRTTANSLDAHIVLKSPNLAKVTTFNTISSISTVTNGEMFIRGGMLNDTTQYTDFTLTPSSGTITGGTICVYGYQNS
jgi:hypothetical protein